MGEKFPRKINRAKIDYSVFRHSFATTRTTGKQSFRFVRSNYYFSNQTNWHQSLPRPFYWDHLIRFPLDLQSERTGRESIDPLLFSDHHLDITWIRRGAEIRMQRTFVTFQLLRRIVSWVELERDGRRVGKNGKSKWMTVETQGCRQV